MAQLVVMSTDEELGTISGSHSQVSLSRTPHNTSYLVTLLQHICLNKPTICLLNPFIIIRMLYVQNTTASSAVNINIKVGLMSPCFCDRSWQIRAVRDNRSISKIFACSFLYGLMKAINRAAEEKINVWQVQDNSGIF